VTILDAFCLMVVSSVVIAFVLFILGGDDRDSWFD
jgi:hypothetical protein